MIHAFNYSIRQRIKAGFSHTVYGLSGNVANFIFSVLIIRTFSPSLWGSFAQLLLILTLFSQVTNWGNKEFLLREFSRQSRLSRLWQTSVISRSFTLAALCTIPFLFPIVDINPGLFVVWLTVHFLFRSFESLIVFERKFGAAILTEAIGFLFVVAQLLAWRSTVDLSHLVIFFISSTLLKTTMYGIIFRKPFLQSFQGKLDLSHLVKSLPFLLPSLIGFTQAKADTLVISVKLSRQELGVYYVLMSLLTYCHAIPVMIITPFLKNLYRINPNGFLKVRRNFLLAGIPWSLLCMGGIYVMMEWVYRFSLPLLSYGIAWLALPPYFIYYLVSQQFLRDDRPYSIVLLNGIAAIMSFIFSIILVQHFGFNGGLMACAGMQWLVLAGYIALSNRSHSLFVSGPS